MIETTTIATTSNVPLITDWLMFFVTVIYVIATIFIYRANIKSADAAHEQIEESRKQFKETTRLNMMPFFEFEKAVISAHGSSVAPLNLVISKGDKTFVSREYIIRNIGLGAAKNIRYKYINLTENTEGCFVDINAISSNDLKHYNLEFETTINENIEVVFEFCFQDLLENNYTQKIIVKLSTPKEINGIKTFAPVLVN